MNKVVALTLVMEAMPVPVIAVVMVVAVKSVPTKSYTNNKLVATLAGATLVDKVIAVVVLSP